MRTPNLVLPHKQSGITLIVGLVMLLLITMIGVNSMQDTNLQERMTMNIRDKNIALQGAESALRAGESIAIRSAGGGCNFDSDNGCLAEGTNEYPNDAAYLAGDDPGNAFDWNLGVEAGDVDTKLSSAPKWVAEEIPAKLTADSSSSLQTTNNTGKSVYRRITVRSFGLSSTTQVILQATYKTE